MKKTKLCSLLLCVAILLLQVSVLGSMSVKADDPWDVLPALPDYVDEVVSVTGVQSNYGQGISINQSGGHDIKTTISPAVDLSESDYIEFDIYITDLENFNAYMTGEQLCLILYTGDGGKGKRAYYRLNETALTHTGWNHFKFAKNTAQSRGASGSYPYSIDWTDVNKVSFGTHGNASATFTATGFARVANVCGTVAEWEILPELPANVDEVVSVTGVQSNYGQGVSINQSGANDVKTTISPAVDLSNSDYIEFDLYITDLENFNAYMTGEQLCLILYTGDGGKGKRAYYKLNETALTHIGWNHFKLAKNTAESRGASGSYPYSIDWTDVNKVSFGTHNNNTTATFTATGFARVANVCGTVEEWNLLPELPWNVNEVVSVTGVQSDYGQGISINQSGVHDVRTTISPAADLSGSDNIEFDLYITDLENFNAYMGGEQLCLILYTGDGGTGKRAYYKLNETALTHTGWNHFTFAKSDAQSRGASGSYPYSIDWTNVNKVSFGTHNNNTTATFTATGFARVANVCGTDEIAVPTDVMAEKISMIGAQPTTVTFDGEGVYTASFDADISETRMIELDVYVFDNTVSDITVKLTDGSNGYALYDFTDLSSGWNHLAIRLADGVDDLGNEASIDFADITSYSLISEAGASIAAANFYAADYVDGDSNRDGVVNILDLIRTKKYAAGQTNVGNICAMDLSGGDYVINASDVAALTQVLL